ncbi:MAG: cell envelope integrity protein TolA [Psychromonas sp.]|nr:cell envelope integrity protein TolA [Psychromonas sp.]
MKNKEILIPLLISLFLHVILVVVIIIIANFSVQPKKPEKTSIVIKATFVNQTLFKALTDPSKQKALKQKRIKNENKKENERIKHEKALKKQKEAKRIEDQKLIAMKQEKDKKEAEIAKKKEIDKLKKQRIKRQKEQFKAKQKAQQKAFKDAKLSAQREAQRKHIEKLDQLMEADFDQSSSSAKTNKEASEINRYKALIKDKISRNWQVDSSMKNKKCILAIRLAADGLVLSAIRTDGDPDVCNSARRATFKAKTLPIPSDPEIAMQFRDFDITLEPNL